MRAATPSAAPLATALAAATVGVARKGLGFRHRHSWRPSCHARAALVTRPATASVASYVPTAAPDAATLTGQDRGSEARPLQIVKIDLESNSVVVGEQEIQHIEDALRRTGAEKVAVIGVMGAFRTGKSFLLDLMLRYVNENTVQAPGASKEWQAGDQGECEIPEWVLYSEAPDWVFKCGDLTEGRVTHDGKAADTSGLKSGFKWRPGMDKCTEGIWVWSEAFVLEAGGENVAVLLMDTQGAWDAKMTKEQSATVFGLTTLMTSRLIYNVSKQIQQDKIDNLLYFVDFAQAALRTKENSVNLFRPGSLRPFQTLEFLVRDWPHYPEGETVAKGREMMLAHLGQYQDPKVSADTHSMDTLGNMFEDIDIWCLPHPSLQIERESWRGDLDVIDPTFWRFLDRYVRKIFSPEELRVKTTLGTPLTVNSFGPVLREFIKAFGVAAPQAKTFAQAMETSTSLLAYEGAVKILRNDLKSLAREALDPEDFEVRAAVVAGRAAEEFQSKAIFGSEEGIQRTELDLREQVEDELVRYREENTRKLENVLGGLTDLTLASVAAFVLDRVSDVTCDWWLPLCQELSTTLAGGYFLVAGYVAYSAWDLEKEQGSGKATVALIELWKSTVKRANQLIEGRSD